MVGTESLNNSLIELEAEALRLVSNFEVSDIDAGASNGAIIRASDRAVADTIFTGAAGTYRLTLDAYDENDGRGIWNIKVNGTRVNRTVLKQDLGSDTPDASTRVQIVVDNLTLNPGDKIKFIAKANAGENTSLDKITFAPAGGPPQPPPPTEPVEIISNDIGAPNNKFTTIRIDENSAAVTDVNVAGLEDGIFYKLNAGADRNLFTIDPTTGVLSFNQLPDFENPQDADGNNRYEVNVLAKRGAEFDGQFMTVIVEDVVETTPPDPEPDPVPVYLMAGQSNLVGVADTANITDNSYLQPFSAAQIWSRPQDDFVDLAPGFNGRSGKMGPELSFGRRIVERRNEDVYIINYGLGSTSLAQDWNPDGSGAQYNTFTSTVSTALNDLTAQGIDYEIEGLVWMQGESDTYNDSYAAAYEDNLIGFFDSVRGLYGADLDVAVGLIRNDLPTSATNRDLVRDAQRTVSAADPNVFLLDTDALGGSEILRGAVGDFTHYNADGQVLLGNGFADTFVL
ncbi:MAG: sialate O-acetylesterase [Cyanobacteria bacterium J06649_4]